MSLRNDLTPKEKLIIESLIAECRDVGERIVTLVTSLERILYIGGGVLALMASVVVVSGKTYLLTLLPGALCVVLLYGEYVNNDIKCMGAYKKALEEAIEHELDYPVILWESKVVRLGKFNQIYEITLGAMFLLALAGSIWAALFQARATRKPAHWAYEYSAWFVFGTILSICLGVVSVGVGFWAHQHNMRETEKNASAVLKEANKRLDDARAKHP